MKSKILTIATCLTLGGLANAQLNVNIPDANFKNVLVNHSPTIDANSDGEISTTEAQNYTGTIFASNNNISDLTGIEAFVNLTKLYCHINQLTSIDVSANTALTRLYCYNNQLTSLDVSANTALTRLYCYDNQLSSLDVSANTALTSLKCYNNQISSLDVSANTALTQLFCQINQLTSLNVANGNNGTSASNLNWVNATNNSNINCIQHDTGFDPTTAVGWTKDMTASWSDNCPPVSSCTNIVNIPDANFKNALLAHGTSITGAGISVIDTDGDSEICQTEAQAYTGTISVNNQSISDLTGIEAFTGITNLSCYGNSLVNLDVSSNVALTEINCSSNSMSSLDFSNNTALTILVCGDNSSLSNLNISNNQALTEISCKNSSLTSLDVSLLTSLTYLGCNLNSITSLDVSQNTALQELNCHNNSLTSLNVANGNNGASSSNLYYMRADGNPNLTCIQHDTGFDPTTVTSWQKNTATQWSDNCSGGSSGINENNISFSIVPNPTSGMVTIDTEVEISSVEIFSTSGQKVASFETKAFDISALQSGVYFVKVLSDGGSFTTRIIKE